MDNIYEEIIAQLDRHDRVLLLAFYGEKSAIHRWDAAPRGVNDPSWTVLVSAGLVESYWTPLRTDLGRRITRAIIERGRDTVIEAGVVVTQLGAVHWHLPTGRSSVQLPDSRDLWDKLWELRDEPRLGFAHSHPGRGRPVPSHTDLTTFVAVEAGLGRRLDWWITSADTTVILTWIDPTLRYSTLVVPDPEWVPLLRAYSSIPSAVQTPRKKEP